ncbi:MAG: NAD-dependent epimerase/dehydratase family protein [Candidatus Micrarchaeia archaeon]
MQNILITGASGFIGRNLAEHLGSRYGVSAPASAELDLLDAAAVEKFVKNGGFDAVVHCANKGGARNAKTEGIAEANLRMFQNVARCSPHFGKMIQIGSGAEYDKSRPLVRVRESEFGSRVPKDEYGRYKYECSKYIEGAEGITCLRVFGCYGKYEDYSTRFVSNAICRSIFGLPVTIANRNVVFSYLYVDDLCAIVEHFIRHGGRHKFYNAVPDETADLLSIAGKVAEISGNRLPIVVKNPGMGNEYSGDNSLLKKEIPSLRFTGMDEGVQKLHKWYEGRKGSLSRSRITAEG